MAQTSVKQPNQMEPHQFYNQGNNQYSHSPHHSGQIHFSRPYAANNLSGSRVQQPKVSITAVNDFRPNNMQNQIPIFYEPYRDR